jgi:asparagine synthase (glutamine-hydrolysing)
VRRQLVADVPRCTLLSGGLDSSAMTARAQDPLGRHAPQAEVAAPGRSEGHAGYPAKPGPERSDPAGYL